MNRRYLQILIVLCILALTAVLYFLPKKVLTNRPKEGATRDTEKNEAGNVHPTAVLKSISLILQQSLGTLSEKEQQEIARYQADTTSTAGWMKLKEIYSKYHNALGEAYCLERAGSATEESLGMAYYAAYQQSQVDENRQAIGQKVIMLLGAVKTEDAATRRQISCAMADCYVNASAEPMQGITLLRQVISEDSTHEQALYLLGQFAVKSGQTDRAIQRFQSLVKLYPAKTKYSLYLAQLFSEAGRRNEALEVLEKAKKAAIRKSALDSINNSINHL